MLMIWLMNMMMMEIINNFKKTLNLQREELESFERTKCFQGPE